MDAGAAVDLSLREAARRAHPPDLRPLLHAKQRLPPVSIVRSSQIKGPAGRHRPRAGWTTFRPAQADQYSGGAYTAEARRLMQDESGQTALRAALLAILKLEGSSPFIRFEKASRGRGRKPVSGRSMRSLAQRFRPRRPARALCRRAPGGAALRTLCACGARPFSRQAKTDPWLLNELVRRRRLRDQARRPLAVNLAAGLALSEFLASFRGAARRRQRSCGCASCLSAWRPLKSNSSSSAAWAVNAWGHVRGTQDARHRPQPGFREAQAPGIDAREAAALETAEGRLAASAISVFLACR